MSSFRCRQFEFRHFVASALWTWTKMYIVHFNADLPSFATGIWLKMGVTNALGGVV
jgi:hypothetical protein